MSAPVTDAESILSDSAEGDEAELLLDIINRIQKAESPLERHYLETMRDMIPLITRTATCVRRPALARDGQAVDILSGAAQAMCGAWLSLLFNTLPPARAGEMARQIFAQQLLSYSRRAASRGDA